MAPAAAVAVSSRRALSNCRNAVTVSGEAAERSGTASVPRPSGPSRPSIHSRTWRTCARNARKRGRLALPSSDAAVTPVNAACCQAAQRCFVSLKLPYGCVTLPSQIWGFSRVSVISTRCSSRRNTPASLVVSSLMAGRSCRTISRPRRVFKFVVRPSNSFLKSAALSVGRPPGSAAGASASKSTAVVGSRLALTSSSAASRGSSATGTLENRTSSCSQRGKSSAVTAAVSACSVDSFRNRSRTTAGSRKCCRCRRISSSGSPSESAKSPMDERSASRVRISSGIAFWMRSFEVSIWFLRPVISPQRLASSSAPVSSSERSLSTFKVRTASRW